MWAQWRSLTGSGWAPRFQAGSDIRRRCPVTPDPDGLECEVCVENPDAVPGVSNPPGTRAARYP